MYVSTFRRLTVSVVFDRDNAIAIDTSESHQQRQVVKMMIPTTSFQKAAPILLASLVLPAIPQPRQTSNPKVVVQFDHIKSPSPNTLAIQARSPFEACLDRVCLSVHCGAYHTMAQARTAHLVVCAEH